MKTHILGIEMYNSFDGFHVFFFQVHGSWSGTEVCDGGPSKATWQQDVLLWYSGLRQVSEQTKRVPSVLPTPDGYSAL